MLLYDIKQFYILYRLAEDESMNSNQLSKELKISSKTIMTIISGMSEYCLEHGFFIQSKRGSGYSLQITDPSLFKPFHERLIRFFNKYDPEIVPENFRVLYLIFFLLQTDQPVPVHKLKESFYVSASTIHNDIGQARRFLKDMLHITYPRPQHLAIEGDEIRKRNMLTFLYDDLLFDGLSQDLFFNHGFIREKDSARYRSYIIEALQKYQISLSNENFELLLFYVKLSNWRYYSGERIPYRSAYSSLVPLDEYQCAEEILQATYHCGQDSESEKAFLTILLLVCNKHHTSPCEERYFSFAKEMQEFESRILSALNRYFRSFFEKMPEFQTLLSPLMSNLYFALKFHVEDLSYDNINYRSEIITSPFYLEIARIVSNIIRAQYHRTLGVSLHQMVAFSFSSMMDFFDLPSQPLYLLVIPKRNEMFWPLIRKRIDRAFSNHPIVDFTYEYLLEYQPLEQYDLIITDYTPSLLKTTVPVIQTDLTQLADARLSIEYWKRYRVKNSIYPGYIENLPDIRIHEDYAYRTPHDLMLDIHAEFQEYFTISAEEFADREEIVTYYSRNGMVIIPHFNPDDSSPPLFSAYFLRTGPKRCLWRGHSVYQVLFFNIPLGDSLDHLIKVKNFMEALSNNPDWKNFLPR